MDDNLFCFKKNVLIIEEKEFKEEKVTIAIDLKEMLEENDLVKVVLQLGSKTIKEIDVRRKLNDKQY